MSALVLVLHLSEQGIIVVTLLAKLIAAGFLHLDDPILMARK